MSSQVTNGTDPLSELYDVASALRFLEEAFESHDGNDIQVRAGGAAYVTRLMGLRLGDLANALWEVEDRTCRAMAASLREDAPADPGSGYVPQTPDK